MTFMNNNREVEKIIKSIQRDLEKNKQEIKEVEYGPMEYNFINGKIKQAEDTLTFIDMMLNDTVS